MSGEIANRGTKGKVMMWFFIVLILFIALVVYIYKYNQNGVPVQ
jgi:hypothetical protein